MANNTYPNITKLVFNEPLETIDINCFENSTTLKEVYIPKSIKTVGENAFNNCSAITTFKIDVPVTEISSINGYPFNLETGFKIDGNDGSYIVPKPKSESEAQPQPEEGSEQVETPTETEQTEKEEPVTQEVKQTKILKTKKTK